ncbi:MAG: hypothetical protein VX633_04290 [Verrucomicrobiota bacterium]|nr:hypothetical protein [Verrucomicrobiota bacterium]
MKSRLDDLLEFACGEVGDGDFRRFCPNNPGDMSYVDLCSGVRVRQEVPEEVDPEWFEVFGIAQRGAPEKPSESGRFVRFRLFCGAVAAKFLIAEPGLDTVVIVNYVCCSLVQSARLIGSRALTEILVDVFPALAKEMEDYRTPSGWVVQEYPFCLLAGMLMAEDLKENDLVADLAGQLLKAEEQVREESFFPGHEFLLGLTNYDSLHADWLELAESLANPGRDETVQSVKARLGGVEKWRAG